MSTRHQACRTCRHWDGFADGMDLGSCRSHAPRVVSALAAKWLDESPNSQEAVANASVWPTTGNDDWCGEYKSGLV